MLLAALASLAALAALAALVSQALVVALVTQLLVVVGSASVLVGFLSAGRAFHLVFYPNQLFVAQLYQVLL